jgi:SAM-dependent methyltransferase
MDRNARILALVAPDARVLEVGPSFSPILPKASGRDVLTLDHADADELKAKYAGHGVDLDRIEPVDFVWRGGPVHEAVPAELHGRFDAMILSHVLEHSPDPIGLLKSAAVLLREGGVLSLANPDKRYCFDALKPVTGAGEWIEAHVEGRQRHGVRTLFEQSVVSVKNGEAIAWPSAAPPSDLRWVEAGFDWPRPPGPDAPYVDCHASYFTPSSFELLVFECGQLGLIEFEVAQSFPTEGFEFFVTLRKVRPMRLPDAELAARRLALHRRVMAELRDQIDAWLGPAAPSQAPTPQPPTPEPVVESVAAPAAPAPARPSRFKGPLKRMVRRLTGRPSR